MSLSEDRISHLSHEIMERLWRGDLVDVGNESRALACVKQTLTSYFQFAEEIDTAVRAKLRNRAPGSRDWEDLYQKFYQEELSRRKL
jgi:hypothetical protein